MQPLSTPIIELKNVDIVLGGDLILKDVSFKINAKDTLVIIGPSGSGKTVLLKTMAGVIPPHQGHVFCEGEDWQNLQSDEKRKLAEHIGVQFQKSALFDELSTYDNVAFPLKEHYPNISQKEVEDRVHECLESVELWHAKNQLPHELSGGMRLRLGVARALILRPRIIFYDDPTAGLDPIHADNMIKLIKQLKEKYDSTLIITTHSMPVAYEFAGRILFVGNQKVIETGSAAQTKNHPDPSVQQFIHGRLSGPLQWG